MGTAVFAEGTEADVWDGTVDTSWYNETDTEFTITTAEQFAGLAELVNGAQSYNPALENEETADFGYYCGKSATPDETAEGIDFEGVTIKLAADLDLCAVYENGDPVLLPGDENLSMMPVGYSTYTPFKGTFDGQNHTIKNLFQGGWDLYGLDYNNKVNLGLFGNVADATIKNLVIDNFGFNAEMILGRVAGKSSGTSVFDNIVIKNSIINTGGGWYVGGLIGWAYGNQTIRNVTIDETVTVAQTGGHYDTAVGGIIGGCNNVDGESIAFENCEVSCKLDVFHDSVANYNTGVYRNCGMIIGAIGESNEITIDGKLYPDFVSKGLTFNNVEVNFGDWANYTYCWSYDLPHNCQRIEPGIGYAGVDLSSVSNYSVSLITFDAIFGAENAGDLSNVRGEVDVEVMEFLDEQGYIDAEYIKVEEPTVIEGLGTQENPFLINDLEELKLFATTVNKGITYSGKVVKLANDIDLGNMEWTPIGNSTHPFQGTFDGDNHTISNLMVTGYKSNVGLFGFTTNGEVKNLTVNNANVSGRLNVGVVAGTPYTSKYTDINVTGHVEVNGMAYVGGVGGKNAYADWTDITVDVDDTSYVNANSVENGTAYRTYVGGVIGFMGEGGHKFENITSNIDVKGSTCDVGGITGIAHYGNKFINCSSSGDIYMEDAAENEIGGIAGVWHNGGSPVLMENCSFAGNTYIAGEKVYVPVSGPSYSVPNFEENQNTGEITITGTVTLNGEPKTNLEQAITEAKGMTDPAVIDLQGNNATLNSACVLNNDTTFKNGMLVFDNYNGLDPDVYDPSGINYAVMTIGGNVTFDNVILTGKNAVAHSGIFVLGTNGVMSLKNGSVLEVKAPEATAVIYSEGQGKLVVDGSSVTIDGNGNAVRGMLSMELEANNAEISVENISDNAMRNVRGTVDNSAIVVDGAEYGIKNTTDDILTVTNSKIIVKNTVNEDGNAGILLTDREKLADTDSIVDAKIFIDNDEGEVYNTLNFETNGGNVIASVEELQGTVVSLSNYVPEKQGYTFLDWYSDEALTERITYVTLDAPTTVYAKWSRNVSYSGGTIAYNWTVKFETNGGSEVKAVAVDKNDVVKEPVAPTKDGFKFEGWYTDKELTTAYDFSAKVTKNITLYAKWTEVEKEPEKSALFKDVKETDWFYEYVMYVAENGLMNGVSEDEFAPNNTLTRAMLVTVLYRNDGEPAVNKSIPFSDVDMSAYYADAVLWAKQNGIVNGITEIEFAPNSNITREQIATIIYRYAQYKGMDTVTMEENLHFADADEISEYAVSAMNWAVGTGLLKGKTTTTLNPKDNATRAEIAAILQRFIENNK